MDEETRYWVGFSAFPEIGPMRFGKILAQYGSAKSAWNHFNFKKSFNLDAYISDLQKKHVGILTLQSPKYPRRLKEITDAPFVLYILGKKTNPPMNLEKMIGVVGTRNVTPYGREVTKRLVTGLVAHGYTIVSGLAYGVDAIAHQAAIDAGGKTIAVLGCGIDIIAPSGNASLYHSIENGFGAIVSEMPMGLRPSKGIFVARNRIISGLCKGIVVTEGAENSGALITARNATEQGRDVFAVPGPITSTYSRGPARLLKNGAKLVESVDDILEEL